MYPFYPPAVGIACSRRAVGAKESTKVTTCGGAAAPLAQMQQQRLREASECWPTLALETSARMGHPNLDGLRKSKSDRRGENFKKTFVFLVVWWVLYLGVRT
jgi:hypothetical protein